MYNAILNNFFYKEGQVIYKFCLKNKKKITFIFLQHLVTYGIFEEKTHALARLLIWQLLPNFTDLISLNILVIDMIPNLSRTLVYHNDKYYS